MSHNMTTKQFHTAICKMMDRLDDRASTGDEEGVFLDAIGCTSCGYCRYSLNYGASMCYNPKHPIFRLPQDKTCKDHTTKKIEEENLKEPAVFAYLTVLNRIDAQERKLIRIHKDMGWEIKRQKARKKKEDKKK